MNYRTDLAVELDEMLTGARKRKSDGGGIDAYGGAGDIAGIVDAASGRSEAGADSPDGTAAAENAAAGNVTGYIKKQSQIDEDISVIDIEITDEEGERAFGKPKGRYVTLEVQGIIDQKDRIKERAAAALSDVLGKFIKHDYYLKVLVVGLGNEKVTPDSLGPHTVDKVKITSHLFNIFECDGDFDYSNVCGFNPSVTGITGLETADLIDRVVSLARPDAVLAIDALAAKDIRRLSTTIQVCDTGIMPGAGMGNHRKEISARTVGCPVICIGVPTVIDARTLILDAGQVLTGSNQASTQSPDPLTEYLEEGCFDMIVTSTDIDEIIKDFADIIANAINITLHPGIYSKVK